MKIKIINKENDNFATSMLIMLGYKIYSEFKNLYKTSREGDVSAIKDKMDIYLDKFSYFQTSRWFLKYDYSIGLSLYDIKVTVVVRHENDSKEKSIERLHSLQEITSCIYSVGFDGVVDTELTLDFNPYRNFKMEYLNDQKIQ